MRPSEIKRIEADNLRSMTDEYLASGATITIVPMGVGVGRPIQTTSQKHAQTKKKGRGIGITINPRGEA